MAVALAMVREDRGNSSSESTRVAPLVTAAAEAARHYAPVMDVTATERAIRRAGVVPDSVWFDAALRIARQLKENFMLPLRYGRDFIEGWRQEMVTEQLGRLPTSTSDNGSR